MRYPDWPERLAAYLSARRRMPFAWGTNDCAIFAADCVLDLTGTDPAARWRGYETEEAAREIVDAAGGMRALVALTERPIAFAQRGDVVLAAPDGRETFGVCVGDLYAAPGLTRIVYRSMSEALAAFEV